MIHEVFSELLTYIWVLFQIICDLAVDNKVRHPCAFKIICESKISRVYIDSVDACVTFGLIIKLSRFVSTRECANKIITWRESLRTHRCGARKFSSHRRIRAYIRADEDLWHGDKFDGLAILAFRPSTPYV